RRVCPSAFPGSVNQDSSASSLTPTGGAATYGGQTRMFAASDSSSPGCPMHIRLGWLLVALSPVFVACAEEETNPDDKRASEPASDYPRILEKTLEQMEYESGTTPAEDDPCQGLCDRELCGYTCGVPGEQCLRACATADTRAQTYIRFNVPE